MDRSRAQCGHRGLRGGWRERGLTWLLAIALLAVAAPSRAQEQDADPQPRVDPGAQWFVGAYYRHSWIPSFVLDPFFRLAPSITNDGFGLTVSHREARGFTAEIGLGYMPYSFEGAFNAESTLIEDTEYVKSDLAMIHATGSILWPIRFHRTVTLELGIGLDLGVLVGEITRSEAYPDVHGDFQACRGPHDPFINGVNLDEDGDRIEYCEQAVDGSGNPIASNPADMDGEQYGVRENRIPPVMLFPMLPHMALRVAPIDWLAFKAEFAFGVAEVWAGLSVHVAFASEYEEPEQIEEYVPVVPAEPQPVRGRVLGKLMEKGGKLPIGQASLSSTRMPSAIETDERGLFVVDKLDPGAIQFEISHPDYETGSCETEIPERGGDVPLHCFLEPKPSAGAISGQVKDESGKGIQGANIEVSGPTSAMVVTHKDGLFALPDAPAGSYRLRVDADGYLIQLVQVDVLSRETALPQIILVAKPKTTLVTLKAKEIAIKQQVNFAVNSAEIDASSTPLLTEVADVLMRAPSVQLVEIQGHTDDRGGRDHNQALSQARAEAVQAWLVRAGVESARLQARGYGQDNPLRANDNEQNRAKNRRVQLIILRQSE